VPYNFWADINLGVALQTAVDRRWHCRFSEGLEIKPDLAATHVNLGVALQRRGRIDEAIIHYRKALELEPTSGGQCQPRVALAGLGQIDEAIAYYQKALEIKPDYAEAHYNLGDALQRRGQVAEAISHYEKALESNPDYAEATTTWASFWTTGTRGRGRGPFSEGPGTET